MVAEAPVAVSTTAIAAIKAAQARMIPTPPTLAKTALFKTFAI
jgi:hypothetical protein